MFESKINRGRANGYAPLDGSGKVPLDKLPPIQSTINTGSFATTGSNVFTGNQTISGSEDGSLTIGELNFLGGPSFGLRVSGSEGAPLVLTSDGTSLIGAIANATDLTGDASVFSNSTNGFPTSDGPIAGISVQKSGSFQSAWLFDYDGKSYFPGDINIGYGIDGSGIVYSGSLNISKGNINVSGSHYISGSIIPNTGIGTYTSSFSLGSSTNAWKELWVSNGSVNFVDPISGNTASIALNNSNVISVQQIESIGNLDVTGSLGVAEGISLSGERVSSESGSVGIFNISFPRGHRIYSDYNHGNFVFHSHHPIHFYITKLYDENAKLNITGSVKIHGDYAIAGNGTVNPSDTALEVIGDSEFTGSLFVNSGDIVLSGSFAQQVNYAPMGSGSYEETPEGEVTELDITKDIHLIDITGIEGDSHYYLPNGLYDGQVIRLALKGDDIASPNNVYVWVESLRRNTGAGTQFVDWLPFFADTPRSLATAVWIDGAWNIDNSHFGML